MSENTQSHKVVPSRRLFFAKSIGLLGGLAAFKSAMAEMCGLTPAQTPGPFYPVSKITDDSINDLTVIKGHTKSALGEVVYVSGVVTDEDCQPIAGALVEIWQAAASGRYDHPSDTSGLTVDPNFQNWGEFITDGDGKFAFKTIVPGHYPADDNWTRPPHVHFKITKRGFREMVTQMYFTPRSFSGTKAQLVADLNAKDLILQAVPHPDRVIVDFRSSSAPKRVGPLLAYRAVGGTVSLVKVGDLVAAAGEKLGAFDVVLRKVT